jgi:cyclopropane fatty-acyl-phospholipid synthase-like methyltransferase
MDEIKCKNIVCITLSPEQKKYLNNKGYNIILASIWNSPNFLFEKFDAIILNGSTEHFLNISDNSNKYYKMFYIINKCLNSISKSQKVVITEIHFHRQFSVYEYFQLYLLDRTY